MSHLNSSLVCEEVEEQRQEFELFLFTNHQDIDINQQEPTHQPLYQVVKVKGSLTVSF